MTFIKTLKTVGFALALTGFGMAANAQAPAAPVVESAPVAAVAPAPAAPVVAASPAAAVEATAAPAEAAKGSYTPMKPETGKGMPIPGGVDFQTQHTELGEYAYWMHNTILMPIIVIISLFVLGLLLWVSVKFRARQGVEASKTTHNSFIEVVWTLVPVLILVGVAIPSIDLLAKQFKPAPEGAVTVKVTGYQWYWGYTYPDNGGFEVVSNMLTDEEAAKRGEPRQLGVDNRMVVPAGEPIRLQITAADVIHSFAIPSLWFKLDAVPGQINEKVLTIKEPGVYYGQCSELCGARHGYMPISIEALPRDKYEQWILAQGGELPGAEPAAAAAPVAAAVGPAAAPIAPAPAAPAAAAPVAN